MQRTTRHLIRAVACAAVCLLTMRAGLAEEIHMNREAQGADPARWYQEDMTPQARFKTLKKEAGAAYREAVLQCRSAERGERAACLREARANFQNDMTAARQETQASRR